MTVIEKLLLIFIDITISIVLTVLAVLLFFCAASLLFRFDLNSNIKLMSDAASGAILAFIFGYIPFYKTNGYFTKWLLKAITNPLILPVQRKFFLLLIAAIVLIIGTLMMVKGNALRFIDEYTFDNYDLLFGYHSEHKLQVAYCLGLMLAAVGFVFSYAYNPAQKIINLVQKIINAIKKWVN